jgi:hypothetical protein
LAPRRLGAILHVVQIRLGTFPPAARGYVTVDPRWLSISLRSTAA